jgi:glutamate dehydrogenase/leucine dehydrogenase
VALKELVRVTQVFASLGDGYEQVVFGHDAETGLRTIIAVYSTARGPALGGTRMFPYATEDEAVTDVLRLGKAMAYKAAGAHLPLGGGKAVIIADPATDKTPELFAAYARVVDGMGGAYITTADVGTTVDDLDEIGKHTTRVTGTSGGSGDPSPNTAWGVFHGMHAAAERAFGSASLADRHVVVSGVGKVGAELASLLAGAGARVTVADVRTDVAEELAARIGAAVVPAVDALGTPCDILAPCALGPVVTDATVDRFACRAIAGAANNQLATPEMAIELAKRDIVYAPDYIINAGGLINVADELQGYDAQRARDHAQRIRETLDEIFALAERDGVTPAEAADTICAARIASAATNQRAAN